MSLTTAQETTLAAHIRANQDAAVVAALAIRNDTELARLYNLPSATDAWQSAMSARDIFEAMVLTDYDGIAQASKREAWRLLLEFAPIDWRKNNYRKVIADVWGAAISAAKLTTLTQAMTRKATVGEAVFGGNDATANSVTAKKLTREGALSVDDVSYALMRNPV